MSASNAFVAVIGLIAAGFGPAAPGGGDAEAEEMKRLEGTWRAVAVERGGKEVGRDEIHDDRMIFSESSCSIASGLRVTRCTVAIDPGKEPGWIDVTPTGSEVTWVGIYELEGDTLKVCLDTAGGGRPTEFKTREGTQQILRTYRRLRP